MSEKLKPPPSADIRKLAAHELQHALESRRHVVEEHSSEFRWLLASLLAVNGGGLLFLKQELEQPTPLILASGLIFLVGIVFALLTGWQSQRANRAMIKPISLQTALWISVIETGEIQQDEYQRIEKEFQSAMKVARCTQILGWVSAVAFILASIALGLSTVERLNNSHRTLTHQVVGGSLF